MLGLTHAESLASSGLEHLPDTGASLGRALDISPSTDLLSDTPALLGSHGLLVHAPEVLDGLGVVTEIGLACNEDDREAMAEVVDFRDPLWGLVGDFI